MIDLGEGGTFTNTTQTDSCCLICLVCHSICPAVHWKDRNTVREISYKSEDWSRNSLNMGG